jgi:hypothetical protein
MAEEKTGKGWVIVGKVCLVVCIVFAALSSIEPLAGHVRELGLPAIAFGLAALALRK